VIAIGMVVVSPAHARAPWVTGVLLAVIAVASIGNTIAAITTDTPATYLSSPHAVTFMDAVEGALPPPPARRAVHFSTATRDVWPWMVGVTLQLERRGIPVTIDGWEFMVGARRTAASPPRGSTAFTFAGTADADRLRRDPRWREVQTIGDVSLFARA